MLHVALYQPEIPPNTGNIIRLCANNGCMLHLIHPLGFQMDTPQLKRAGLDYHQWCNIKQYQNWEAFNQAFQHTRRFACTTKAETMYDQVHYRSGDVLLFGPETKGLPTSILDPMSAGEKIRVPMLALSRSINLANAVSIVTYEALRQLNFPGLS